MNIKYGITEEVYSLGNDRRVSYGIAAYAEADNDGTATIVASVHDVTANKKALMKFVLLCNTLELSVIHLNDVVENFLAN